MDQPRRWGLPSGPRRTPTASGCCAVRPSYGRSISTTSGTPRPGIMHRAGVAPADAAALLGHTLPFTCPPMSRAPSGEPGPLRAGSGSLSQELCELRETLADSTAPTRAEYSPDKAQYSRAGRIRTGGPLTPRWPLVAAYVCNRARAPWRADVVRRSVPAVGGYSGANGIETGSTLSTVAAPAKARSEGRGWCMRVRTSNQISSLRSTSPPGRVLC
jgi:hypothetical protein